MCCLTTQQQNWKRPSNSPTRGEAIRSLPGKVSFQLARQRKPAADVGVGPHADPGPTSSIIF